MRIFLGTTSEIKKNALDDALMFLREKNIFNENINIDYVETESGVPATPHDKESYIGASNRALSLFNQYKDEGDLFIGLESGLIDRYGFHLEECWCVILDKSKAEYIGISSAYILPSIVKHHLDKGGKHVDILDSMGQNLNISPKDTWGIYTKNILSRRLSMFEAYRNAFTSFLIKH